MIKDTWAELDRVVNNLNRDIEHRMDMADLEVSTAYRKHVKKVGEELKELRDRTDKAEWIVKRDEEVVKLKSQMRWFSQEALLLSEKNCKLEKERKMHLEKIDELK